MVSGLEDRILDCGKSTLQIASTVKSKTKYYIKSSEKKGLTFLPHIEAGLGEKNWDVYTISGRT